MTSQDKNLFIYWEGKTLPYIRLCRKSIIKNANMFVHVVTPTNIDSYLSMHPTFKERLFKLRLVAQRSDYIRVALLNKYGGFWIDSDCVMWGDMYEALGKYLKEY